MNMKGDFNQIIEDLQNVKPWIHIIPNNTTAGDCVSAALAAGADATVSDEEYGIEMFVDDADALILDFGSLTQRTAKVAAEAVTEAVIAGIPVIMDIDKAHRSAFRIDAALKFLQYDSIHIVCGNFAELEALSKGTDESAYDFRDRPDDQGEALRLVKSLAEKYHCVFVMTGPVDYISDGKRALMINGGNPLLERISGAGSIATTLVAACAAVAEDKMTGAMLGLIIMGQAAELAAGLLEKKDGPGMFKVRLIDGIYHVVTKWNLIMDNLNPEKAN